MRNGVWVSRMSLGDTGLSVAVKDSIDIAGYQTLLGSQAFIREPVPRVTAQVVQQLIDAGFHIVGKTHMHELAFGMTGVNRYFGTPINTLYPDFIPGGSSSGSAVAVACGDADVALGTDTGGSVRGPAACCGVYGFKPTFGRVSRAGVWPRESSLDCVGGFASDMDKLARLQATLDPAFDWPLVDVDLAQINIGYYRGTANEKIHGCVAGAFSAAKVKTTATELPLFAEAFAAGLTIISYETLQAFGHLLDGKELGDDVRQRLQNAKNISEEDLAAAETVRRDFTAAFDQQLARFPVIAMPALPDFPLTRAEALAGKQDLNASYFIRPFNLSGHPAIVIPLKNQSDGPCAIQLVAAKDNDSWLFSVATALASKL